MAGRADQSQTRNSGILPWDQRLCVELEVKAGHVPGDVLKVLDTLGLGQEDRIPGINSESGGAGGV